MVTSMLVTQAISPVSAVLHTAAAGEENTGMVSIVPTISDNQAMPLKTANNPHTLPDLNAPGLLVMDVDSTLIDEEVIDELGNAAGVGDAISAITAQAMNGSLDFSQSLHARVRLLEGLDASVFDRVYAHLHLTNGALELIEALHRHQWKVGVVSGGFTQIVDRLAERSGLDYWMANTLEVVDGTLTGDVLGDVVDKTTKLESMKAWAALDQIPMRQTVAVGDGSNDIPMIESAGLGIAFCAKPAVQQAAHHAITRRDLRLVLNLLEHNALEEPYSR